MSDVVAVLRDGVLAEESAGALRVAEPVHRTGAVLLVYVNVTVIRVVK